MPRLHKKKKIEDASPIKLIYNNNNSSILKFTVCDCNEECGDTCQCKALYNKGNSSALTFKQF